MPVPADFTNYLALKAIEEQKRADVEAAANAYNQALSDWDQARYAVETEAVNVGGTPFPGA